MLPIQAPQAVAIRILSGTPSEKVTARLVSSSGQQVVIESSVSTDVHSAVEVWCDGVVSLGEVAEEHATGEGLFLITIEVLHLLNVDSVSEHSRFWS